MNGVSPCCGAQYAKSWISECCDVEMEGYREICPKCTETTDNEGYMCEECDNWFSEAEDKTEHDRRIEENSMEEKSEAHRKYGE